MKKVILNVKKNIIKRHINTYQKEDIYVLNKFYVVLIF